MTRIQINYLDGHNTLLASHITDDEYEPAELRQWDDWLNDSGTEHPGAPEEWTQFELVESASPHGNHRKAKR